METDVHFARLLADLPEALVCVKAFLGELAKKRKVDLREERRLSVAYR